MHPNIPTVPDDTQHASAGSRGRSAAHGKPTTTRLWRGLCLAATLVAVGAAAAQAGDKSNNESSGKAATHRAVPQSFGGVTAAGNARLAAVLTPNFRADNFLIRSKGVASVSHPFPGEYCIKPSFTVNVHTLVPVVSVEWGESFGNGNFVQYHDVNHDCPADRLEIYTFHFNPTTANFEFSDLVAFTIVVP